MRLTRVLLLCVAACCFCGTASADLVNINIIVDENAHGTLVGFLGPQTLATFIGQDPGPGGLASVLQYDLGNPPGLVAGDVLVSEAGGLDDVIRFNPTSFVAGSAGSLAFYSDNLEGSHDLADTSTPPSSFYTNQVSLMEGLIGVGIEGVIYTPVAGQPGFVAGASVPVRYTLISDAPEPTSWLLLGTVSIAVLMITRKRLQRRAN
jgi:hypothetical protein